MKNWYRRWMLKRIIKALQIATEEHGLKEEVVAFAGMLEATNAMVAGMKMGDEVTMTCTKKELAVFLSYMIQLHNSKLSLLTRARIGLVTLLVDAKKLMPKDATGEHQDPLVFAQEQFDHAKSSKDEKRIKLINE